MTTVSTLSSSTPEIEREIWRLKRIVESLSNELARRKLGGGDKMRYGFPAHSGYETYETFSKATQAAIEYYKDPDAGYRVTKVYL